MSSLPWREGDRGRGNNLFSPFYDRSYYVWLKIMKDGSILVNNGCLPGKGGIDKGFPLW